jgi:geranylgeranyl diphosphate synthase, type II
MEAISQQSLDAYLDERAAEVNKALEEFVPGESAAPQTIHKAMRYSLLAGGKRLRPVLVLTAGEALGAPLSDLMPTACAVEMIHTYSLIHDDLPAMDDDDLRRGRPTCHKVFGDAIAILAGDALLTQAFIVLSSYAPAGDLVRQIKVVREIATAAGTVDALIGGQVADIESEKRAVDGAMLEYIHRSKTGALIKASVVVGGIIAGASDGDLALLGRYGEKIGLAFQVADDILDVTSTSEAIGKTPGKDLAAQKATYPAVHGLVASREHARQLTEDAASTAEQLGPAAYRLQQIARFIVARRS